MAGSLKMVVHAILSRYAVHVPVLVHACAGVGAHTRWPLVFSWGTLQLLHFPYNPCTVYVFIMPLAVFAHTTILGSVVPGHTHMTFACLLNDYVQRLKCCDVDFLFFRWWGRAGAEGYCLHVYMWCSAVQCSAVQCMRVRAHVKILEFPNSIFVGGGSFSPAIFNSDIQLKKKSPHFVFYIICLSICCFVKGNVCLKFAHCFVYSILKSVHF